MIGHDVLQLFEFGRLRWASLLAASKEKRRDSDLAVEPLARERFPCLILESKSRQRAEYARLFLFQRLNGGVGSGCVLSTAACAAADKAE
jgi:hypothetical protein